MQIEINVMRNEYKRICWVWSALFVPLLLILLHYNIISILNIFLHYFYALTPFSVTIAFGTVEEQK